MSAPLVMRDIVSRAGRTRASDQQKLNWSTSMVGVAGFVTPGARQVSRAAGKERRPARKAVRDPVSHAHGDAHGDAHGGAHGRSPSTRWIPGTSREGQRAVGLSRRLDADIRTGNRPLSERSPKEPPHTVGHHRETRSDVPPSGRGPAASASAGRRAPGKHQLASGRRASSRSASTTPRVPARASGHPRYRVDPVASEADRVGARASCYTRDRLDSSRRLGGLTCKNRNGPLLLSEWHAPWPSKRVRRLGPA